MAHLRQDNSYLQLLNDSLGFWGLQVLLSLTRLQVENVYFCETENKNKTKKIAEMCHVNDHLEHLK